MEALALGWPKKEVMELLTLGFLADSAAMSTALRLSDMSGVFVSEYCISLEEAVKGRRQADAFEGARDALIGHS